MADDLPFYDPKIHKPPPRQPNPGELLFDLSRLADHIVFRCELRTWPDTKAVEAQWYCDGHILIGRRFDTREQTVRWAKLERDE